MSTIERIALEADVREILCTTAVREVAGAAYDLARVADPVEIETADPVEAELTFSIERMEQTLRAYREINTAEEPTRATVGFLAGREVDWRAGEDGISLPTTGHEVDEFLEQVELHRTLIGLRDSLETAGEATS